MEQRNFFITSDLFDVLTELRAQTGYLRDIKPSTLDVMVTCPFHSDGVERNPSCGVSKVDKRRNGKLHKAGTVHCFTCGYTAPIEVFVSNIFGKKDGGAFGYKWLSKHFISVEIDDRKPLKLNLTRGITIQPRVFIGEEELDSYRYFHPYMYTRKLTDKVIEYFDIGFDKDTNCMTLPVRDAQGNVPFVYRRSVVGKFFSNAENTPRGEYLYGMYEVLKNKDRFNEVIVCEAPIDALTAWANGRAAVATFTAQVTEIQIKLLTRLPQRKLISGYDNDEAGFIATAKISKGIQGKKLMYKMQIPKYAKDLNDINREDWERGIEEKLYTMKK